MPTYCFGEFELNTSLYQLRRDGAIVEIGPRVFDLLAYLIQHRERLVSKDELIRQVWGATAMSGSSVPTCIAAVRKVLGDDPASPVYVETLRGRGYRFVADATRRSAGSERATGATPLTSAAPTTDISRSIFVGRENELAALYAAFERALAQTPQLVLVVGEPGIGKTRTIEEFACASRDDGAVVLLGRCVEGEGAPAFWPWVQIVRTYVDSADISSLPATLGPLTPSLLQMIPDLSNRFPDLPPPPTLDAEQARFRLFDAVTALLAKAAAERPLVVLLDDLHRADTASLLLLQFATHELREAPVLFIGTYRDAELQTDTARTRILSDLAREEPTRCIHLRGLTPESIEHFVAQSSPTGTATQSLVNALYDQTSGNPFFLTQIVHLLAAEGRLDRLEADASWKIHLPGGIRDAVARQLDGLPPETRRILEIGAVAGREFDNLVVATAASATDPNTNLAHLEPALDARLISAVPGQAGRYRFSHVILRDCIYDDLPALERAQLHQRIGEALEQLHSGHLDPRTSELAYHFHEATPTAGPDRAITYSIQAAESANSRLAYEDVPEHYRRAISLLARQPTHDPREHGRLLLTLGEAEIRAGERDRAKETFKKAVIIARANNQPELLAHAALGLAPGFLAIEVGVFDPFLISMLEEALVKLGDSESPLRAQLLARLSVALVWGDSPERRTRLSQEAIQMARKFPDPTALARALIAHHGTLWAPKHFRTRRDLLAELGSLANATPDPEIFLMHKLLHITASLEAGEILTVRQQAAFFRQVANDLRRPNFLWYSQLFDSMIAILSGRFEEAEILAARFLETGKRARDKNVTHAYAAQLVLLQLERGRASEIINSVQSLVDEHPTVIGWRCTLAYLFSEIGRLEESRQEFERLAESDFKEFASREVDGISLNLLASTCAVLADRKRAALLYHALMPASEMHTVMGYAAAYFGPVADRLGQLASIQEDWEAANRHFDFAIRSCRSLGSLPWLVHAQHNFAKSLLARNSPRDRQHARELKSEGSALARRLGMNHLAEKLRKLNTLP